MAKKKKAKKATERLRTPEQDGFRDPVNYKVEEIDWETADDETLNRNAFVFCFDVIEFGKKIKANADWVKIVSAHLYIDHILTCCMEDHIQNEKYLPSDGRISTYDKINICASMGWIQEDMVPILRRINRIRNLLAHRLDFKVSIDDKNSIKHLMPKRYLDRYKEYKGNQGIKWIQRGHVLAGLLGVIIVHLDMERQFSLRRKLHQKHRLNKLNKAVEHAKDVLQRIDDVVVSGDEAK